LDLSVETNRNKELARARAAFSAERNQYIKWILSKVSHINAIIKQS